MGEIHDAPALSAPSFSYMYFPSRPLRFPFPARLHQGGECGTLYMHMEARMSEGARMSALPEHPITPDDALLPTPTSTIPADAAPTAEAQTLARALALAAEDALASDILVLDIAAITTLADYFVVCTADNDRMLRAIVRGLDEQAEKAGIRVRRQEGAPESGWVLMDFGDVIAHVFGKREREYYQLDRLWADAPRILVIQ